MVFLTGFIVAVAGGLGASLRYLADRVIPQRFGVSVSTLLINVSGSFLIGLFSGQVSEMLPTPLSLALTVGLLGGFTTLSAASLQATKLIREGKLVKAFLVALLQLVLAVAAAALGLALSF